MRDLQKIFYDPKTGYTGFSKFWERVKAKNLPYTRKQAKEFYDNQFSAQVNKPLRKRKEYFKIIEPFPSFQVDIMFLRQDLARVNRGIGKFLVAIEATSKKAFLFPLKKKTMTEIINALRPLIVKYAPIRIITDDEFNNKPFRKFLDVYDVDLVANVAQDEHITSHGNRLGIVDAFVRTFKGYIERYISASKSKKIIDVYEDLLDNYNNAKHSGIRDFTPNEVFDDVDIRLALKEEKKEHNAKLAETKKQTAEIGDKVRIAMPKGRLEKGAIKFSDKLYEVVDVSPFGRFKVKNQDGQVLRKSYLPSEILPVKTVEEAPRLQKATDRERGRQDKEILEERVARRMRREGV